MTHGKEPKPIDPDDADTKPVPDDDDEQVPDFQDGMNEDGSPTTEPA